MSLDGNVFAGNQFNHVRFKYKGGPFEWFDNNTLSDCVVEIPTEVALPAQLVSCKREQMTSLDDDGAFGSPVRAQPTGCVKQNAEGKLVLKTDGWDNGKNCKDSGLTVLQIFLKGITKNRVKLADLLICNLNCDKGCQFFKYFKRALQG